MVAMIGWIEPITDTETGVDHLGMRVAGENLYAQLLDFTTTVSWRPRYFSFLAWALREAYEAAGGVKGADGERWNASLRRYDYAIAAATLLADPDAQRIAGSRDIAEAIEGLDDDEELQLRGDHLGAANASLAIYAGPMSQLGLVQSAGSVYRPSPSATDLADAFEASLRSVDPGLSLNQAWRSVGLAEPCHRRTSCFGKLHCAASMTRDYNGAPPCGRPHVTACDGIPERARSAIACEA